MIKKINEIKNIILDEEKEILFIKKLSNKRMKHFLNRIEKDIYNFHKYSLSKVIKSILSDVDNLEKAISLSGVEKKFFSIHKELKNILKLFMDLFNKYNITNINDINVPLNPSIHQAISLSYSKNIQSNYVIEIMQKGYKLYDRVLRPAMVVVAT